MGAAFAWNGRRRVGAGRMTETTCRPGECVEFRLEFLKPFKATNTAVFAFRAEGGRTRVTWSMTGRNGFVGKAIGMFIDCDRMMGLQFELGLANLKALVESNAA